MREDRLNAASASYAMTSNGLSRYGGELDLATLVWTRGAAFPLARLESRLKCPRCGSRRVVLLFEPPSMWGAVSQAQ
jgi:hypothetical protein